MDYKTKCDGKTVKFSEWNLKVSYGLGIAKYFLDEIYYRKDINSTIIRLKTSFHQKTP